MMKPFQTLKKISMGQIRAATLLILLIGIAPLGSAANSGNSIESIRAVGSQKEKVNLEVIYNYDGSEGPIFINVTPMSNAGKVLSSTTGFAGEIGHGRRAVLTLARSTVTPTEAIKLYVLIASNQKPQVASRTFDWSFPIYDKKSTIQANLNEAIDIIDSNNGTYSNKSLQNAKDILDKVIFEDPNQPQAYLELARIAMQSDGEANERSRYSGLDEARRLIQVAIKIDPNYANSYVLYGYVLGISNSTKEAIIAFKKAEQLGTNNLWLWYNWALALENAGRIKEATAKYNEGAALLPLPNSYELRGNNRAADSIFWRLTKLLEAKHDWKNLDVLYQKQLSVLDKPCGYASYASFKLFKQGLYDVAIEKALNAYARGCESKARPVLAAAYLTKWARAPKSMDDKERNQTLNKGQALVTNSQEFIVSLAGSSTTSIVLTKLKEIGFQIDGTDAKGMTPLAYAASNGDTTAVDNLISNGANPNRELTNGWTTLMIAVASNRPEIVEILLRKKVDMEHKTHDGQSALSIARNFRYSNIVKLLEARKQY